MRKSALLLLALGACTPSRFARAPGSTDLERAIEATVAEAEKELLRKGRCSWRVLATCTDGFVLASGGEYHSATDYFASDGDWVGTEKSSCTELLQKGSRRCEKPQAEFLCPRALSRVRRVGATIRYHGTELRLAQDTEVDANDFRGAVHFSGDATKPISLTITALASGVELRALPFIEDGFGTTEPRRDDAPVVQLEQPIPLPAWILVNGYPRVFGVKSQYVPVRDVSSRSASAEPAAR